MDNRLEILRRKIDELLIKGNQNNICLYISHMAGVAQFCTLLAMKRSLNVELAATCGMLHDIFYMTGGSSDHHAVNGAKQAKTILKSMKTYSDDEIKIITDAISNHSNKKAVHGLYDELLKDADVLDHCLCNTDFPIAEKEVDRFENLLAEFGIARNP